MKRKIPVFQKQKTVSSRDPCYGEKETRRLIALLGKRGKASCGVVCEKNTKNTDTIAQRAAEKKGHPSYDRYSSTPWG
jgi:hypothetical protein